MTRKYTAKNISVLKGLEPVRRRPAMYIGGVDATGLHHLVWEILDNSIDEVINGYATSVEVETGVFTYRTLLGLGTSWSSRARDAPLRSGTVGFSSPPPCSRTTRIGRAQQRSE